jgi:hypothetical protein
MNTLFLLIRRLPVWGQNLVLCCASVIAFGLVCEFLIFRFIFLPTDIPTEAYIDDVIRYEAGQKGVYRWRNGIAAPFAINDQGWNSALDSYSKDRGNGLGRIAIIGDSYVHAAQVPFTASFAEVTQEKLRASGCPTEVFRFGMSGAPLSQYLHVLRKEVISYHPDIVIVLLVHNDFDESFLFMPGRYSSSFLKLQLGDGVVAQEIQPQPYHPGPFDRLRLSATFRYLYYTQRIRLQNVRDLVFGVEVEGFEANIDVQKAMRLLEQISVATDYTVAKMAEVTKNNEIELVLVMDGHRQAIYGKAEEDWGHGPLALNALASQIAQRHNLALIDLHEYFREDWRKRGLRFEDDTDWHWNAFAHRFVADVLVNFLEARRSTLGCGKGPAVAGSGADAAL